MFNDLSGASFAQYEVTQRIGSSGMAHVYLARDRTLKRMVTIKFLSAYTGENWALFVWTQYADLRAIGTIEPPLPPDDFLERLAKSARRGTAPECAVTPQIIIRDQLRADEIVLVS